MAPALGKARGVEVEGFITLLISSELKKLAEIKVFFEKKMNRFSATHSSCGAKESQQNWDAFV